MEKSQIFSFLLKIMLFKTCYLKIRENLKSDKEIAENLEKELGSNSKKLQKMSASEKYPTFSSMSQNLQKI